MHTNLNIFEFIDLELDPVYALLNTLTSEREIKIHDFSVRKEKFYEVENDEVHLAFKDKMSCYQFLSDAIVKGEPVHG